MANAKQRGKPKAKATARSPKRKAAAKRVGKAAAKAKAKIAPRVAAAKATVTTRVARATGRMKAIKAKIVKAKPAQIVSADAMDALATERRITDEDLERGLSNADMKRLAGAPLDTLTTRRITDADMERGLSNADLERLATAPLDTLSMRRLTPDDVAKARVDEPANENAAPAMTTARIATIAPRNVFLPDRVIVDVEGDTFPSTKLDEQGRDEAILPDGIFDLIQQRAAEGQRLVGDDPIAAFRVFRAALDLLPAPVENWNAGGWLLVALGEAAIQAGDFARAFAPLKDAMHCPGTVGNPWVHLRLGQCRFELDDDRAADELSRAYIGGGRAMFEGLDPKYFALVERVLQPPPGHDRLP